MNDLRDDFSSLSNELEKKLTGIKLPEEQKKLFTQLLDFGYSAAFCERTSDMSESYFASEKFREGYERVRGLINK